jgi:predicted small metal-binding protein
MKCGFEIRGASSQEELLKELEVHARMSHNMSTIPQETLNQIKAKIKSS